MCIRCILTFLFIAGIIKNISNKLESFHHQFYEKEILLHNLHGSVGKENFSYYSLYEEGPISIVLETENGDADLYISATNRPKLNPSEYDLVSATCGVEEVLLPDDMKRPIFIGVYGHPSYELSNYTMSMYFTPEVENLNDNYKPKKDFAIKDKLQFIVRNTAMWRIFEILEGVFFLL